MSLKDSNIVDFPFLSNPHKHLLITPPTFTPTPRASQSLNHTFHHSIDYFLRDSSNFHHIHDHPPDQPWNLRIPRARQSLIHGFYHGGEAGSGRKPFRCRWSRAQLAAGARTCGCARNYALSMRMRRFALPPLTTPPTVLPLRNTRICVLWLWSVLPMWRCSCAGSRHPYQYGFDCVALFDQLMLGDGDVISGGYVQMSFGLLIYFCVRSVRVSARWVGVVSCLWKEHVLMSRNVKLLYVTDLFLNGDAGFDRLFTVRR